MVKLPSAEKRNLATTKLMSSSVKLVEVTKIVNGVTICNINAIFAS